MKSESILQYLIGSVLFIFIMFSASVAFAQEPSFYSEKIFPFRKEHVHGSTIVQLPNGDLLVAWYEGSGERWADDVQIMGSRKKKGTEVWSKPFILADVKGFPDINPILFLDGKKRLWLMWYTVIANQWETSLLKYRISEDYMNEKGAPRWAWQADLLVKAGDKAERGIQPGDSFVLSVKRQLDAYVKHIKPEMKERFDRWKSRTIAKAKGENMIRDGRIYNEDSTYMEKQLGYAYFRRMGWQTRNKPFITDMGRMIVPLYSDGFGFSLMAFTDDWGKTWQFSNPLVGIGNVQPAIAQTKSGELVAYMRDNGPSPKRLQVSHSEDNGKTWSFVKDSDIPNPGSAADIVTLKNGDWVLIYNDVEKGRSSLAVSLSEDNGKSWPWTRKIELDKSNHPKTAHYPAIIQGANGELYVTYSYYIPATFTPNGQTIKYAQFNEAWIKGK